MVKLEKNKITRNEHIDGMSEEEDFEENENLKSKWLKLKTLYLIVLIILLIFTFIFSFKTGETLYYLINTDLENEDTDAETRFSNMEF